MAAGLGFKEFTTGNVLTAADANGFLASQVVMVFDDAAARTTAITSPQEGMITYLKDTNAVEKYDGAAFVAVGGGASPLTTKGDLYTFSTVDARLPVGTDGHTLVADSVEATGLKWAAPAGGGDKWTLLNAGGTTLSGSSTTVSGISNKEKLFIIIEQAVSSGGELSFRFNGISTTSYETFGNAILGTAVYDSADVVRTQFNNQAQIPLAQYASASSTVNGYLLITGCASTTTHKFFTLAGGSSGGSGQTTYNLGGFAEINDAIISVTARKTTGTFTSGTIFVYANS